MGTGETRAAELEQSTTLEASRLGEVTLSLILLIVEQRVGTGETRAAEMEQSTTLEASRLGEATCLQFYPSENSEWEWKDT